MSRAIKHVGAGLHDPHKAHARIRDFYSWSQVAERTERAYEFALSRPERSLWERIQRSVGRGRYLPIDDFC